MELWGGIECAHVHLRDRTVDQLELTGHLWRESDLKLLAPVGFDALRYPLLRDHILPPGAAAPDWSWSDQRLTSLRRSGIRPVVTLLHHGTRYGTTDVRHGDFAQALAGFAGLAAERYPWLQDFTPINEPLTSARFSCLYGHWWPHRQDDSDFLRALASQVQATILCMQAIRRVNPAARLIHVEDLGFTHSTGELAYQAAFENERRWLGLDLLCGRVTPAHPFHDQLQAAGLSDRELAWFEKNACPPDVQGCNYYPTSERYLSGKLEEFPEWSHGGNGIDSYADVHAGIAPVSPLGVEQLLLQVWERYGLPLALTEVHLHGPAADRADWFQDAWSGAQLLNDAGIRIEAVCSWALFGSFEWNSLLTERTGHYEAGAFDISSGQPRETALLDVLRQIACPAA